MKSLEPTKKYDATRSHCHIIDIAEGDVYNRDQAFFFHYFDGIRECYFHTEADPYVNGIGLRIKYNKYFAVPRDRTAWESRLQMNGR